MSATPTVTFSLPTDEARAVWLAVGMAVTLMDDLGDTVPADAPLYGKRDCLEAVARRLDHEINRAGGPRV